MSPESRLLVFLLVGLGVVLLPVRRSLAATLARAGRPSAYFFTITAAVLLLIQAYLTHGHAYPFASWTMYGQPSPPRSVWEITIRRSDGTEDRLDPWRVVRGPDARALMRSLENGLARIAAITDPEVRDPQWTELVALLDAMLRLESRRGERTPAVAVNISRCMLLGVAPWEESDFACEPFQLLPMDEGHLRAP